MSRKTLKQVQVLTAVVARAAEPRKIAWRIWDAKVPDLHLRIQPSGVKSWNVQWVWPKHLPRPTDRPRTGSLLLGKWPALAVEAARTQAHALLDRIAREGAPKTATGEAPVTLGDFIEKEFTPYAKTHYKAGEDALEGLRAVWEPLYSRPLVKLSALDFERIKRQRVTEGRKPATVNRDLDRIRAVLTKAVDAGALAAHPMRSVKRVKGVDNSRVRYLTPGEETQLREALLKRESERRRDRVNYNTHCAQRGKKGLLLWAADAFTDHLAPMILIAMQTGMRRGELFGIRWQDVNLPGKLLTVPVGLAKSRKARHIPLNSEALDVLTRWKPKKPDADALVFPSAGGGRFNNVNKSWAGIASAAKLDNFRFHDLRHTFASKLVMAGVDLNTVRELLGHADIAMTLRYAHLAPEKLADAVAKLVTK